MRQETAAQFIGPQSLAFRTDAHTSVASPQAEGACPSADLPAGAREAALPSLSPGQSCCVRPGVARARDGYLGQRPRGDGAFRPWPYQLVVNNDRRFNSRFRFELELRRLTSTMRGFFSSLLQGHGATNAGQGDLRLYVQLGLRRGGLPDNEARQDTPGLRSFPGDRGQRGLLFKE